MATDTTLDPRDELHAALSTLSAETIRFLNERPGLVAQVMNQVGNFHAEREAWRREVNENRLEIASLIDQLRGTEDAIANPKKGRSELEDLKENDRLIEQRDELKGRIASLEGSTEYLETQLALVVAV